MPACCTAPCMLVIAHGGMAQAMCSLQCSMGEHVGHAFAPPATWNASRLQQLWHSLQDGRACSMPVRVVQRLRGRLHCRGLHCLSQQAAAPAAIARHQAGARRGSPQSLHLSTSMAPLRPAASRVCCWSTSGAAPAGTCEWSCQCRGSYGQVKSYYSYELPAVAGGRGRASRPPAGQLRAGACRVGALPGAQDSSAASKAHRGRAAQG